MSDNNKSHFDFLWKEAILPSIEKVYAEIDEEFKNKCCVSLKDMDDYKKIIYALYEEKREWLKEIYMPHQYKSKKPKTPLLDLHKIGSIITRVMIKSKPISFNFDKVQSFVEDKFRDSTTDNTQWFVKNAYCNYTAAFYAGIGITYIDTVYRIAQRESNEPDFKKAPECKSLAGYKGRKEHESFQDSCILGLAKNDFLDRDFDYFAYAIILYQLQEYNIFAINHNCFDEIKNFLIK